MSTRLNPFGPVAGIILGCLESGLTGKHGTAAIHTSKNGLRLTLNSKTLVKGKTVDEFVTKYRAAQEKALKS